MNTISLALAFKEGIFREGLTKLLDSCKNVKVVGIFSDEEETIMKVSQLKPDLVLVDAELATIDLAELVTTLLNVYHDPSKWDAKVLPDLYALVSKYAGVPIPVNQPVTGKNAFTHCAGVHTHAAVQNPAHYQSLDPEIVGRKMKVSLDHMSGISSLQWALEQVDIELDMEQLSDVLQVVKSIGQKGRTVDLTELKHIVEWCRKHDKPA